ncbi:hypothetical protein GLYMA_06G230500v4 [Glycine max]|uniref:Uncharacterized protein n=2 Tax=Glycine subgen. Soja TaxID=1462606 RepID=A0A0R0JKH3_SOYBN|nr:hypothetical protein JHK87_016121 [Glycine soja]KAH1127241.1 hypothetical protein GYH30_015993 [Glycine max]KRH55100.1 hypothetical protein GLYMA_06G230500v4 [Glycine max]RZC08822.1 hypothetical protein D0Y65_015503 [Glycine soja]
MYLYCFSSLSARPMDNSCSISCLRCGFEEIISMIGKKIRLTWFVKLLNFVLYILQIVAHISCLYNSK